MYKNLFILLAAVTVTSCAGPIELAECEGSPVPVNIIYGDSELRAEPPLRDRLERGGILRFNLQPQQGYAGKTVTITGKSGPAGSNVSWIDTSGTANGWANRRQDICIDTSVVVGVYKYDIAVQDVGTLDPRADVER